MLDLVALENLHQSRDVVNIGMGQDDKLNSAVPEGQLIAKLKTYLVGIGATVDKDLLVAFLNQDGIAATCPTLLQSDYRILS